MRDGVFDEEQLYRRITKYPQQIEEDFRFELGKMAIFPLNKEMHAMLQYEDLLSGIIVHCYSSKFIGNVGMKINSYLSHIDNNRVIEDIDLINWDDFYTLVLGHLGHLSNLYKIDYKNTLVLKAMEYGKNIFAFDEIEDITRKTLH